VTRAKIRRASRNIRRARDARVVAIVARVDAHVAQRERVRAFTISSQKILAKVSRAEYMRRLSLQYCYHSHEADGV
jgi:hypothetical protein